jgi:cell division septum initiation protein DivIVA
MPANLHVKFLTEPEIEQEIRKLKDEIKELRREIKHHIDNCPFRELKC